MDRLNNGGKDVLPQRRGGGGGLKKILAFLMITGVVIISCQNLKVSNLVLQVQVGISSDFNAPVIVSSSSNQQSIISLSTSDNSSYHDIPNIEELVKFNNTTTTTTCPPGLTLIQNTHFPTSMVVHPNGRKIPKIIHITSRYRCATPAVIQNVDKWRFQNYSVYFHDDQAMDTLFTHPYTRNQFPTLREGLKCATNGATKADLWRYLVLYMYGGIYTDIDNSPTGFNGEAIQAKDDSFFAVESLGILSQFFLASSFGHPLMATMLEVGVQQLKGTRNVMKNFPAQNTGPGACKNGFIKFMAEAGVETDGYVEAGLYFGANNRSVTVIGTKERSKDYIDRQGLSHSDKTIYYKALGITHFSALGKIFPKHGRISCKEHLERTNGTDKVANYHYVEELKAYREVNTTVKKFDP